MLIKYNRYNIEKLENINFSLSNENNFVMTSLYPTALKNEIEKMYEKISTNCATSFLQISMQFLRRYNYKHTRTL